MKRRNNIFLSAFVLIATFAFIISPLGVLAASDSIRLTESEVTEAECRAAGGTVITNFYMFLEGTWVVSGQNSDPAAQMRQRVESYTSPNYDTGKGFALGKGAKENELISAGQVTINSSSTGSNTSTDSWSLQSFYTKAKEGGTTVSTGTIRSNSDKTIYWATDVKWKKENGEISTDNIDINYDVQKLIDSTYPSNATIDVTTTTIQPNYTGEFAISRPIDVDAILDAVSTTQAIATGGHIFNPQVYYAKYCKYSTSTDNTPTDGDNGSTPTTSTGFKIEYDANGGISAPDTQVSKDGSSLTISKDKPSYQGYTFLGWSEDPKATEPQSKYDGGKVYAGPNDLKLYAVWSPKTGVSDYLMATGIVAGVAGLGLFISKRKKLFKQI